MAITSHSPSTSRPPFAASGSALRRREQHPKHVWMSLVAAGMMLVAAQGCGSPDPAGTPWEADAGTGDARGVPGPGTSDGGGASSEGGGAPTSGPGVVADGKCTALCANASTDVDGDGWGFEGASCVVPGSNEAKTRAKCTIGAPLPQAMTGAPAGTPGVVVENRCLSLCTVATDPDGDGWGWEFESSCVIPMSATAKISLPCAVGAELPKDALKGKPGRLLNGACVPICTAAVPPSLDGFGFEFGGSCVIAGSAPATTMGIDCAVGVDDLKPTVVLNPNPPAGMVAKPAHITSTGFFVSDGRLYDKFGNDFIMRGVNNAHIWFDASNQWLAYQALDDLAKLNVNTVRVVWQTNGSADNLARVLRRIVELQMIPMVELHDVTGGTTNESLLLMASYYTRDDVKKVLIDYENFLLVNIANEWSGTDFRGAYTAAIAQLRAAGLRHTLVIDANNFGSNGEAILTDGPTLLAGDPQRNLLFSLHMYLHYAATPTGRALITSTLDRIVAAKLPVIIGEFGWQFQMTAVDSALIMAECQRLRLGYLAWSWKGNGTELAYLDMAVDWEGKMLTTWGRDVIHGPNGIMMTGKRASIFTP